MRTGVVTLPRFDCDAFACGADFHVVIIGVAVVAARHVGQGVLVAGFFRYPRIELFHDGALDSVIDFAARVVRVVDQAGKLSL